MNIVWRPRAADDFERLITEAWEANAGTASRDKSLVETRLLQLVRFAELGRKTRRVGVRELPIEGTSYIVVNRHLGEDVLIIRIFHTSNAGPTRNF
ncbi:MAG TPA: type II toxin-antitoxin system RelE/ParE family toxin [Hyphomonadaceae bacterium]|nr:type II toxin-antitoxin system RelE/ParE family toxin [Hyphomonadaceae bacterium]